MTVTWQKIITQNIGDAIYADIAHTHSAPDHGALGGLTDDDHTQYALLAGRSGGQTVYGGTASGDDLYVYSTSHATKGDIVLANGGGRVGIGQLPDAGILQVYAGNSGGTPTNADYVPISIENDTSAYIQMLTPNNAVSGIAFSDPEDWDNGFISYSHSTQVMTFAADAVETMYLTDGRVGIGTTSPGVNLHVSSATEAYLWLHGDNDNSAAARAAIAIGQSGTGTAPAKCWSIGIRSTGELGIGSYRTNAWADPGDTPYITVKTTGEVGIGTTSPNGKLTVVTTEAGASGQWAEFLGSGLSRGLNIMGGTGASTGIGYRAMVLGSNVKLGSDNIPEMYDASGGYDRAYAIGFPVEPTTDPGMTFWTGSGSGDLTQRMVLTNAGNVGIGTLSPQRKLHVAGTILVDGDEGGYAGAVGFTDVTNGVSSGNGTVKMAGTTARDSTGWLKIYVGTTAVYLPYFTTIT